MRRLANVEEDNWEWHTFDTIKGGDYLVDQDAAEIMCKEAIDAVIDLEKMGLPFNQNSGGSHRPAPVRRPHPQPRRGRHCAEACYAADRTGHMILQTLYQNCIGQDVEFYNEFYVLDLVMGEDGQRTAGVVAYELATGEIHVFRAKSVVFATGVSAKVFKTDVLERPHPSPATAWGSSTGGDPLEDMEFYQFHPTSLAGLGRAADRGRPR